jgi:DNA repair protein RadC
MRMAEVNYQDEYNLLFERAEQQSEQKIAAESEGAAAFYVALRDIPDEMLPRERLQAKGVDSLSDRELLALLLGRGVKGKNVMRLARELLNQVEASKRVPSLEELKKITGLGLAQASKVIAMLEFGRRHWGTRGRLIRAPSDAFKLIQHYADFNRERFLALSLNGAHEVLATRVVSVGLVNKTLVHPREVFADVIGDRATAVLVAHNHPSGNVYPSSDDNEITSILARSAEILGIYFMDHLVFSLDTYYSYRNNQKL